MVKEYSSYAESPFGKLMTKIQKDSADIKFDPSENDKNVEIAKEHIKLINSIASMVNHYIPNLFDKGNKPNFFSVTTNVLLVTPKLYKMRLTKYLGGNIYLVLEKIQDELESMQDELPREQPSVTSKTLKAQISDLLANRLTEEEELDTTTYQSLLLCLKNIPDEQQPSSQKSLTGWFYDELHSRFFTANPHLRITHPETLTLSKILLENITTLPDNFQELFSFLNPQALSIDLSKFRLPKIQLTDNFKLTLEYGGEKDTILVDEAYGNFKINAPLFLADLIGNYYEEFGNSQFVQNELQLNALIQSLITKVLNEHKSTVDHTGSIYGAIGLISIEKARKNLNYAIESIDVKIKTLAALKDRFRQTRLDELLKAHDMEAPQWLDPTLPLPAAIIIKNSQCGYKPLNVYKKLEKAYSNSIKTLEDKKKSLKSKQDGVEIMRTAEIENLKEATLSPYINPVKKLQKQLQCMIDEDFVSGSTSQDIAKQLQNVSEQQKIVDSIQNEVYKLENIQISCSEELTKADDTALPSIKKQYQDAVTCLKDQRSKTAKHLNSRQIELQRAFEKAKQQELLKNLNTESIGTLIAQKKSALNDKIQEITQVESQLQELNREISTTEQILNQHSKTKDTKTQSCLGKLHKIKEQEFYEPGLNGLIQFTKQKDKVTNYFDNAQLLTVAGVDNAIGFIEAQIKDYTETKSDLILKKPKWNVKDYENKLVVYNQHLDALKILKETNQLFSKATISVINILEAMRSLKPLVVEYENSLRECETSLNKKNALQTKVDDHSSSTDKLYDEKAFLNKEIPFLEKVKAFLVDYEHSNPQASDCLEGESNPIQTLTSSISKFDESYQCYNELNGENEFKNKKDYALILNTLHELLASFKNNIQSSLITIVKKEQEKLQNFSGDLNNIKFDEASETYDGNKNTLENIKRYTQKDIQALIEEIKKTKHFSTINEEIELLATLRSTVEKTIKQKSDINEKIKSRIAERQALVKQYIGEFDAYLKQRGEQYHLKDTFFSKDAANRKTLIEAIKNELKVYSTSGNNQTLLGFVASKKQDFPGFNLQSLLNRMALEVSDLDKKVPENYDEEQAVQTVSLTCETILQGFEKDCDPNKKAYAKAIKTIYSKIQVLDDYSATLKENDQAPVSNHAKALKSRVDAFVIAHQDELPSKEKIANFQIEFSSHLHSKDDVMCKHDSWMPLIANIAIAVFSLGLATGIQLIHSKLDTGRFAFFFDRSERLKLQDKVDEACSNIPQADCEI